MSSLITALIGRLEVKIDTKCKPRRLPKGVTEEGSDTETKTDLRRIFEEVLALNIIPNTSLQLPLELIIEYEEQADHLEMRLHWKGLEYNPLMQGDEISLKLVRSSMKEGSFHHEDGENRLIVSV